jgi:hypothetical protein
MAKETECPHPGNFTYYLPVHAGMDIPGYGAVPPVVVVSKTTVCALCKIDAMQETLDKQANMFDAWERAVNTFRPPRPIVGWGWTWPEEKGRATVLSRLLVICAAATNREYWKARACEFSDVLWREKMYIHLQRMLRDTRKRLHNVKVSAVEYKKARDFAIAAKESPLHLRMAKVRGAVLEEISAVNILARHYEEKNMPQEANILRAHAERMDWATKELEA